MSQRLVNNRYGNSANNWPATGWRMRRVLFARKQKLREAKNYNLGQKAIYEAAQQKDCQESRG
jgi:hypothetical protein